MTPIPILMYHQIDVAPIKGTPMRGLVVSPGSFWRHMAAMKALGYLGLSMSDLEPYLSGEKTGKVFGITFDDGYENNLMHALPVLRQMRFTSTCYVVGKLIGRTNVWDQAKGIEQKQLMTVAQMQEWVNQGQEIGSHTLTHCNLTEVDAQRLVCEIVDSKRLLDAAVRQAHGTRHFCYPYGAVNGECVRVAESAGYATATTTQRGRVQDADRRQMFLLPRVLVSRSTSWMQLLVKCITAYEDRRRTAMV
ncbi:MAG: polysaccharide deacetylase family protein [Undibacterium sp.]|uniref:polysaccharide deacetylase family protein n=1 Tax=Undibacterium sp. TaxID=1914977 RepID=UPI00271D9B70|nr:polysaccharide deacetylase family protein [Undibacterium sp.]MDO8651967.1 polysaccharide deacetylase family protein [Undibacterium sp.]